MKRTNSINSFNLYNSFIREFGLSKNIKEREISNSINIKIENSNNIVKENNKVQKFDIQLKIILKR